LLLFGACVALKSVLRIALVVAFSVYRSPEVATWCAIFLSLSTGMFHSSVALLPQSFAMCCILRATAHWLNQQWAWSIFWTGASCLLGWPFAVVVGVPLGVDILRTFWGKELLKPLGWAICSALAIIVPTLLVDFYFYHKWFLAVVNIALYNVPNTGSAGANLYGVEPWTFYLNNLLLNFNIVFLLALISPILTSLPSSLGATNLSRIMVLKMGFPLLLWLAVMWPQPHKEERFLFIVYPFFCLNAALACVQLLSVALPSKLKRLFKLGVLAVFIPVSISRSAAFVANYRAPLGRFVADLKNKFLWDREQSSFNILT